MNIHEETYDKITQYISNLLMSNLPLIIRDLGKQFREADGEGKEANIKANMSINFSTGNGKNIGITPVISWKKESKYKDEAETLIIDPEQPDLIKPEMFVYPKKEETLVQAVETESQYLLTEGTNEG